MSEQQDDKGPSESVPQAPTPPVAPPPTPPESPDAPESLDSDPPIIVEELSKSDKDMAMYAHVSGLSGIIGIPSFVGPLIIYLTKKDESEYIAMEAGEALNFQISMTIYVIVSAMLCFICIGYLILPVVMLVWFIFTIIAAIKASEGIPYRYPLTIRMIK